METGPLFYVVIRRTWRSNHLQVKGSTFISQLFKDNGPRNRPNASPATPMKPKLSTPKSKYSQLLPCGHPHRHPHRSLTEIDSHFYGLLLKRTLTQRPFCVHYEGSWRYCSHKIILPLAFGHFPNNTVQFSLWLTSIQWHAKNYCSKIHLGLLPNYNC